MSIFDDMPVKKKPAYEIGQDLSRLSVGDIDGAIADLAAEIERLRSDRAAKQMSRDHAATLFKS
jgi:uncharacterized small protein (DUF1192 family)